MPTIDEIKKRITDEFMSRTEVFMVAPSAGNLVALNEAMYAYQAIHGRGLALDYAMIVAESMPPLWVKIIYDAIKRFDDETGG